ncbi:APC family permease [Micromonospora olivasterospora]|uniref:Amino acid/polyamine/organocation transporter (APC superfamily) n=1 Tax=Micromonospora olivasterospora TaxID=1880 RepID=A0A562IB44_MICOL|nr:APC family permease [Micromonospora olivasterospora]TWH68211.1 amino acid/polyamine/organocation transporter (APC superfamily) [Micromonospora olivasterospora]
MGERRGEGTVVTPSAEFPPLGAEELDALRRIGDQWRTAPGRPGRSRELPVDPTLGRYRHPPTPTRFGRLASIELFRVSEPGEEQPEGNEPEELVATEPANLPGSRLGRGLARVRRVVLGPPLRSSAVLYERMRKLVALPVLSSDLLSSVAYGPEAMLTVLVLAGSSALGLSLPLAALLVLLMVAVGISYRQTIPAYPHGAGSYIVASDNLGSVAGLSAAAGLMMDYVLTVAVSIAAGVNAVTSALPGLTRFTVPLGILVIAVLLAGNLRGVRTAGNIFAFPTYAFIVALVAVLGAGFAHAAGRGFAPLPPPHVPAAEGLGLLLVLRAFSSGAVSMTGIEAVSNAVPAFRPTEWRNARTTLSFMVGMLVFLFAGIVVLIHLEGVVPVPGQTVLSQLARRSLPTGPWYALVQAATALILLLAANTAYNDFPRLLFFMARAGHAPRRFLHLGDRLAFSNGLVVLSVTAAVVFVAFGGHTESLIPLYAVGVFLAFTLSQAGMVVHWRRHRGAGWRRRLTSNALGAALSGLVLLTAAFAKFAAGAWVVVLAVPLLVLLFHRVRVHYRRLNRALALRPPEGTAPPAMGTAAPGDRGPAPRRGRRSRNRCGTWWSCRWPG